MARKDSLLGKTQSLIAGLSANNTVNNSISKSNVPDSRLLRQTEELRNFLLARNLYTLDNQYSINSEINQNKVINSINSVLDYVIPFKAYNLKNTVYGRLMSSPNTQLVEIGLKMLAKQFEHNLKSNLQQQFYPTIKPMNIFRSENIFSANINFSITKKTGKSGLLNLIEKVVSFYPPRDRTFGKESNNFDYITNTGKGQLISLFDNLRLNIYRPVDDIYYKFGDKSKGDKKLGNFSNLKSRNYFDYLTNKFNPYLNVGFILNEKNLENVNNEVNNENKLIRTKYKEYAPDINFINDLGETNLNKTEDWNKDSQNKWINNDSEFSNENNRNKLIWGRDGINNPANVRISGLRGAEESILQNKNDFNSFSIKTGLLNYTKNLLNASLGQFVDITRKVHTKKNKLVGMNGSALWKAPEKSLFKGKTGVRQHSILDQYDNFSKAIRFDGNKVYGGNENSVGYESVIPKFHPILDKKNKIDNKKLMFSIENLAVTVISTDNGLALIDDGKYIPESEAGLFGGRVMWFPPYNLTFNEVSSAKFDTTVMVGRNEPIYSYMNSERTGTISFTLIMDYPEQVRNFKTYKEIAEFFTFGGGKYETEMPDDKVELKYETIADIKTTYVGKPLSILPELKAPPEIRILFQNDKPNNLEIINIFDLQYSTYLYEVDRNINLNGRSDSLGLNKGIYLITGVTGFEPNRYIDKLLLPSDFSQYNVNDLNNKLNASLYYLYSNEKNRKLFDIKISARTSKLFLGANEQQYNLELGKRRAESVKIFLEKRIFAIFNDTPENLGIRIYYDEQSESGSFGSSGADVKNATKERISAQETKLERAAIIEFIRNNNLPTNEQETNLSSGDEGIFNQLSEQQRVLEEKSVKKGINVNHIYNERQKITVGGNQVDGAILDSFKSISGQYFYPVFHSQTPEDFHRRLTFLQQCVRQGSAMRTPMSLENGLARAKNSVFGKQPICVLRIGDFFHTKIVIDNITIDYNESPWDVNPEGFGVQPMIANVTLQIKIIGGQSLKGPIDALQNAVSFNYYANSTFSDKGIYKISSDVEKEQYKVNSDNNETDNKIESVNNTDKELAKLPKPVTGNLYNVPTEFGTNYK